MAKRANRIEKLQPFIAPALMVLCFVFLVVLDASGQTGSLGPLQRNNGGGWRAAGTRAGDEIYAGLPAFSAIAIGLGLPAATVPMLRRAAFGSVGAGMLALFAWMFFDGAMWTAGQR